MPPDKPPLDTPLAAGEPSPEPQPPIDDPACPLSKEEDEGACALSEITPTPATPATPATGAGSDRRTSRIAALIYMGISLTAAAIFVLVTTYVGSYPAVARYGGAAWVFILLMIVLMPLVIPRVKKRRARTAPVAR